MEIDPPKGPVKCCQWWVDGYIVNSDESEIRVESGAVGVARRGIYSVAHGNGAFVKEALA